MHIADVGKGMLGANDIGTLAVAIDHIAAVRTGYGPVIIAGQGQQNTGDVTADIGGSATTDAVTGKISSAIASLAKAWSGKNVTMGPGVDMQVTVVSAGIWIVYSVSDGIYSVAFATAVMPTMVGIVVAAAILTPIGMPTVPTSPLLMAVAPILPILAFLSISTNAMVSFVSVAYAMQVVNGLVYVLMVILLLAIIGAFVALAVIGHATNIVTGLAVSLQDVMLPVTVIAAGIAMTA